MRIWGATTYVPIKHESKKGSCTTVWVEEYIGGLGKDKEEKEGGDEEKEEEKKQEEADSEDEQTEQSIITPSSCV